jgi:phage terminase large subunit-like protein
VKSTEHAFDAERWKELADPLHVVPDGALITLGFDGSRSRDATALVATEAATGFQWPLGIWQRPPDIETWEVPVDDVYTAVAEAFRRYQVWRLYADPPYWETHIRTWTGMYGEERVIEWWTNRYRPMAFAIRTYTAAMTTGEVSHSGDALFAEHIGNAIRHPVTFRDDDGKPLWVISKERSDSPHKIDAAMAGCLSWEARTHALASGLLNIGPSIYEERGLLVL